MPIDAGGGDDMGSPGKRREFASVEHLGPEAIAAYVDGEMTPAANRRAESHLRQCPECRAEVQQHRGTAHRVRCSSGMGDVHIPQALVERLNDIAAWCAPGPSAEDTPHCRPGIWERIDMLRRGALGNENSSQQISGTRSH